MKKKHQTNPTYVSSGNVIDDIGLSQEEVAALKLKLDLHNEILKIVQKKKLKPRDLEIILDQPQSRISELLNGKMSKMSAEKLAGYLSRLGHKIVIISKKAA